MTCRGRVTGGVVVLEKPDALPEGAEVKVEMIPRRNRARKGANGRDKLPKPAGTAKGLTRHCDAETEGLWQGLLRFAGTAKGLPPDMAENHDHYLYGTPKRKG
ncbi:MAG: hypothetical protein NTW87_29000 [Planctomycetota bacterium]|nr:hypothetical protein [Planctomycetota bacterium]